MKLTGVFFVLPILLPIAIASPTIVHGDTTNYGSGSGSGNLDSGSDDICILNFALTLGHLTQSFYSSSLSRYDQAEFKNRGYPEWVRGRYDHIKEHETTHVDFLYNAVKAAGAQPVERCEYKFPDSNAREFIDLSEAMKTVSASMFNGLLKRVNNKEYVSVLGSMLGVQARHAAWINSAVKKQNPWNTAFETPITVNQAWSIVKNFISSCPHKQEFSLLPEGLRAFPSLTLPERIQAGERAEISFENTYYTEGRKLFASFLIGTGTYLQPVITETDGKRYVIIPKELKAKGAVYIIISQTTEANGEELGFGRDEDTVAGPAMVMFSFDSLGKAEGEGQSDEW